MVNKDYSTTDMPGWDDNSLGYHTSDGKIFHNGDVGKETEGTMRYKKSN